MAVRRLDLDSDTFTNLEEYQGGSDPSDNTSVPPGDADGDAMDNQWEVANGFDPLLRKPSAILPRLRTPCTAPGAWTGGWRSRGTTTRRFAVWRRRSRLPSSLPKISVSRSMPRNSAKNSGWVT